MKNINISIEALEYSLIKYGCEYLYGFKDPFLKYDKMGVYNRFDKIADDLEYQKLIRRSFSGDISFEEEYKKILDVISHVEIFYDISLLCVNDVLKKYRVYQKEKEFIVIEINNSDGGLNYVDMIVSYYDENELKNDIQNIIKCNVLSTENIIENLIISNKYFEEIKKAKEEDIDEIIDRYKYKKDLFLEKFNKIVRNPNRITSIQITNMKKKRSGVLYYLYDLSSLIRVNFNFHGNQNNCVIDELSNNFINKEIENILNIGDNV